MYYEAKADWCLQNGPLGAAPNMLMLSSAGPIKTVVGACATAAESVAVGVETIQTGAPHRSRSRRGRGRAAL